jgi:fibronectin type 3 domain-containing protein
VATVTAKPEETSASAEETLSAAAFKYYVPEKPPPPAAATTSAAPAPAPAAAEPVPVRIYKVVPVSARNHRGALASVSVPLVEPPQAPPAPVATYSEKAISLTWLAVAGAETYNVYEVPGADQPVSNPLTTAPQATTSYDDARVEFGKERCYRVTAVRQANAMPLESVPSPVTCVTPSDSFAPPPPAGVAAVAGPGSISLIWDAVSAGDLAGYVVLRGASPGDTLQALTPEPIKETTYRDTTVTSGQTYVYVVVAVDEAKNMSAQSARVEETAR